MSLQAGLKSLKCLAFLEDGGGDDDASQAPPSADGSDRCGGTYGAGHLEAALRPSELLKLRLADARRDARVAASRSVPFGCVPGAQF